MIAGTLARLTEPADEQLETWFRSGGLPGLHVERTQQGLDGRPVQQGTAATKVESTERRVDVGVNVDGEAVALDVSDEPAMDDISTEWVADVTGSGLLAAESVAGEDRFAFPFDLFASVTGRDVELLHVDVAELHTEWSSTDSLGDVWMTGASDDEDATSIQYHEAADVTTTPTFGMGFVRPWNGTVERGVIYESGYAAIYSSNTASAYVRFVEDELLPFAYAPGDESEQSTLVAECDRCGREPTPEHGLTDGLCITCVDAEERGGG